MAHRKITVESGLRKGDYRKLTYWNMFKKDVRVLWLLAALVVIGAVCILLGGNYIWVISGSLLAACPLLILLMTEYNILKVARRGNIEQRTTAYYTLDEQGITARSEAVPEGIAYRWEKLSGVYENLLFYIFFINRVQMLTIRKTDLTPEDRRAMLALLQQKLPADKLHLR